MIVYNVMRRWFTKQEDAEAYRKQNGLSRGHTLAVRVEGREHLASLLNALCDPPLPNQRVAKDAFATPELIDRAFVPVDHDIPDYVPRFLLDDEGKRRWDERHLRSK